MSKRAMTTSFLCAAALAFVVARSAAAADKVVICHFPPGNPSNVQIIEVAESALDAHFAHGDAPFHVEEQRCID